MQKSVFIFIAIAGVLIIAVFAFFLLSPKNEISNLPSNEPQYEEEPLNFTANFEVYTNGTRRIFTDTKYHNLSTGVYITKDDPGKIYVAESGIAWKDFFETLPMELTYECLVTGTGQKFCTGEGGNLKFYLNDKLVSDFLEREIKSGDKGVIKFE